MGLHCTCGQGQIFPCIYLGTFVGVVLFLNIMKSFLKDYTTLSVLFSNNHEAKICQCDQKDCMRLRLITSMVPLLYNPSNPLCWNMVCCTCPSEQHTPQDLMTVTLFPFSYLSWAATEISLFLLSLSPSPPRHQSSCLNRGIQFPLLHKSHKIKFACHFKLYSHTSFSISNCTNIKIEVHEHVS